MFWSFAVNVNVCQSSLSLDTHLPHEADELRVPSRPDFQVLAQHSFLHSLQQGGSDTDLATILFEVQRV